MSHVTDTFIFTSVNFDPEYEPKNQKIIDQINSYDSSSQYFKRLDDNDKAYGGAKVFQASIWSAAYNYLDIEEFIDFLKTLDWPDDAWVQVCYQDENDEGFTLVNIKGETSLPLEEKR